jgi:hypothetical protein
MLALILNSLLQVNVSNVGLRVATNVTVSLPTDSLLSLVSFRSNNSLGSSSIMILEPGDTAILILRFAAAQSESVGQREGTIVVSSLEISSLISYGLVVHMIIRLFGC